MLEPVRTLRYAKLMMFILSVIIVGLLTFVMTAWFVSQRHVFKGPQINVELFKEAHNETLHGHQVIDGMPRGSVGAIADEIRRKSTADVKQN